MKKCLKVRCNICNTLAEPKCSCNKVAVTTVNNTERPIMCIYSDNLSLVDIVTIWEHNTDVVHMELEQKLLNVEVKTLNNVKVTNAL